MDEPPRVQVPLLFHVDYAQHDVNVMNEINAQANASYRLPQMVRQEPIHDAARPQMMTDEDYPPDEACEGNPVD